MSLEHIEWLKFNFSNVESHIIDLDEIFNSFQETMKWIDQFSKDNDFEIIIRPRPMTPKDELVKAYKEINGNISENIHFVGKVSDVRNYYSIADIFVLPSKTSKNCCSM